MCNNIALNLATITCIANLQWHVYVPGTASTLKNGDLVQFGTDTRVAIEVCLGLLVAFLLCHVFLGFALDCLTPQF